MQPSGGARPLVTFLSDFGTDDVFVGLCHAGVLATCPQAAVVDLSHTVAPQDVAHGAARLADAVGWVRQPAVHLAVVDPGVGTERRAVVLACGPALLVGPDNGLLLPAAERLEGVTGAWGLTVPASASATFHGRDVFAPAAGRLASGADPASLGTPIDPPGLEAAPPTAAYAGEGRVRAAVRDFDRFGNLQLTARASDLARAGLAQGRALTVHAGGTSRPAARVRTFGDLDAGALGVLEDSFGWAAVVVGGGSAARGLDVGLHDPVIVESDVPSGPKYA